jgi:thermitase
MHWMTRSLFSVLALCLTLTASAQTSAAAAEEILVKFRPSVSRAAESDIHESLGSRVVQIIPRIEVRRVRVPSGVSIDEAVRYYANQPSVEFAEPNYTRTPSYTPNDPLLPAQWGPAKIGCPPAWDLSKGSAASVVAVIDTGIDLTHEDLRNKLVTGYDFAQNDADPTYTDPHGVHTAGIACADTDNGVGIAGVGFRCKVMPLKIFPGGLASTSAQAIVYAADRGVKVISMSYGSYSYSQAERNATDYAWSKGVVLVAAAGNDNSALPAYPASYPRVIGVGSTDSNDQRSLFSNGGSDHVSVAAPGDDILSTYPGGYTTLSGTSMACPHVSGLAALLFSLAPGGTTNTQIRNAIETTADPVGSWVAYGRINAFKAIKVFDPGPEDVSLPVAVQPGVGVGGSGGLTSILASDELCYAITSVPGPAGQSGSVIVTLGVTVPVSTLRTSRLILEANGPLAASNRVYLWNFSASRWDPYTASSLKPSGANRVSLLLPRDLSAYVSGGEMRVLSRALLPARPSRRSSGMPAPFLYKIGFMQLLTRPSA